MSSPTLSQTLRNIEDAAQMLGKYWYPTGNSGAAHMLLQLAAELMRGSADPNTLLRLSIMGVEREDALSIANTVSKILVQATGYCRLTTSISSIHRPNVSLEYFNQ